MIAVKSALRLERSDDGGFLLGSSAEAYAALIAIAEVWVLAQGETLAGFAIGLPDPVVRASDLWERRARIVWDGFDGRALDEMVVGYFDQLAVLPAHRGHGQAAALAVRPVIGLLERGVTDLFATTVREPFLNRAAWSLLEGVGARRVGQIDEVYPDFGPLVSDLHHAPAALARARVEAWGAGPASSSRARLASAR